MTGRFLGLVGVLFGLAVCVTGCASEEPVTTFVEPSPVLLTAEEAGGGEQAPLVVRTEEATEYSSHWRAAMCGPESAASVPAEVRGDVEYLPYMVRYQQGDRSVVIGIIDQYVGYGEIDNPFYSMRSNLENGCKNGVSWPWGDGGAYAAQVSSEIDGYPEDSFAFQSSEWFSDGEAGLEFPDDPTAADVARVSSTSRVYTRVGDYVLVIKIDQESAEIPSADELRDLWEKQMAKLEGVDLVSVIGTPVADDRNKGFEEYMKKLDDAGVEFPTLPDIPIDTPIIPDIPADIPVD